MKVVHLVSSLKIGGAERFVIDLCRVQKNNGLTPAVLSLGEKQEPLELECQKSNIPVARYSGPLWLKLLRVFWLLRGYDVLHIHTQHGLKFIRHILPLLNIKIIYTRHGASPLSAPHWKALHQKMKKYVDNVTFVSQEGADIFHHHHGWAETPSHVIDNGAIINPVSKKKANSQVLRIGSVGRMVALKSQISLLKAVVVLPKEVQEKIEINFFGDGPCMEDLQAYQKKFLPAVNVNFHGMVNDRELIYSSFDVLVVTSETEGLSMVIIEAMANGIPVIASNVGGNPKLVLSEQTGWLFEYQDNERLAGIIMQLFEQPELLKMYGDKAFHYVSENFSIDAAAEKYDQLYQN